MSSYALVWDLDSIMPHPKTEEFQQVFEQFRADLTLLAERSESLPSPTGAAETAAAWKSFLKCYEGAVCQANELASFIGCHAAADADNKLFQQYEARLSTLSPLQAQIATNLEFAVKQASETDLAAMVAAEAYLKEIEFFLSEAKRNAALRLPKEQELLAADLAVDGFQAWGRLYDRISGALRISIMEKGEVVQKSVGQVQFDMAERPVRENNFHAADKAWSTITDTCADAINHIAGTRLTKYKRLGLKDHLDAPLRANRLQRKTLESMWSAISSRKQMMVDYLNAKAKLLGIEKLAWYDQAAPLPAGNLGESKLSWDEACRITIETFHGFSPDFGQFAERALSERWIEAENRAGKRQGGFCTDLPIKRQSRIFMTFTHSPDSMSTLAHELGHAYHSHVLRGRPAFLRDYPMNLAETASTFAEAVLGEERLARAKSKEEKLAILDGMLGDAVAFLMNIHARFLFEDAFHEKRASGELTADDLCNLMVAAQKEAYANSFSDDGYHPRFWASKLHFYITEIPFYNFPYTFGYLLSLGVYAMAPAMGKDFPEQYKKLLIATGCQETEPAVKSTLGQDLTTRDFWNKSLDIVEQRVQRFKELAES